MKTRYEVLTYNSMEDFNKDEYSYIDRTIVYDVDEKDALKGKAWADGKVAIVYSKEVAAYANHS